ncbi:unnamed protein product [Leptosia nina]|uniref:Uncharacterized protein n=1 Tax=Leptosia nina TaxID=320188 RepID=A0AAV1JM32_9NEOP
MHINCSIRELMWALIDNVTAQVLRATHVPHPRAILLKLLRYDSSLANSCLDIANKTPISSRRSESIDLP